MDNDEAFDETLGDVSNGHIPLSSADADPDSCKQI